jgi:predicted nucleic acid-binding protein
MRSLLDINVLIAIHDRDHVHHLQASHWLGWMNVIFVATIFMGTAS